MNPPENPKASPNLGPPWMISPDLFQRVQNNSQGEYRKAEVRPSDPEWAFIHNCFEVQKPTNRSIKIAHCVFSPGSSRQFEGAIQNFEAQSKNPAYFPKWTQECDFPLRRKVMDRWQATVAPHSPFSISWGDKSVELFEKVKILPLWHGTTAAKCDSICRTGFTYFGKHEALKEGIRGQNTDTGFFGSGIYFTDSARYAAEVYSDGNILLAWVAMREPYPVVANKPYTCDEKPDDIVKLEGQGAYQNYNAHYIPVISAHPLRKDCTVYHACTASQIPEFDEFVVFQPAQTLARFWIEL